MENYGFLKEKYGLHNSEETESAKKRTEIRTEEIVPNNPDALIGNYLNRFKEIVDRKDPDKRDRGMRALKYVMHDQFVIKPEEIPQSFYDNQARIAREQGHGDVSITNEQKEQLAEVIIADQESSLDAWIDYLSSEDAMYPDYLKYFAFRSVTGMGAYDKEKKQFGKRSVGTTKPFPDINREALALVLDALEKKHSKQELSSLNLEDPEGQAQFEKLIQSENFAKLYAFAIDKFTPASAEQLAVTKGKWVKYDKGNDHMPLVESLQGHGTGWCTAGESTAQTQLNHGDFYVYYSEDDQGKAQIPRAAIRMQGDQIAEVRGIAEQQNLDPYITDIVKTKMAEFPDGAQYEKKSNDMKRLTEIDAKVKTGKELNKEDLVFLYQINSSIEGFGYQKDPRIDQLLQGRDTMADAAIVFECEPSQIARSVSNIKDDTMAYIGEWNPAVMKLLPDSIQHLYESFPEKKIFRKSIELSTKSPEEYEIELQKTGNKISNYAKSMLEKLKALPEPQQLDLVQFTVGQLGFARGATLQEIFDQVKELNLELCPPQTGPELRLNYTDQPNGEYLRIAMEPISDSDGRPDLFFVGRGGSGPWLRSGDGRLDGRWGGGGEFVFRVRK